MKKSKFKIIKNFLKKIFNTETFHLPVRQAGFKLFTCLSGRQALSLLPRRGLSDRPTPIVKSQSPAAKRQTGIAALLTIIIVSAATLIMAYNASLLGLGELDMGYSSQKGGEALALADGCVEDAFWRLRLDSGYAGGSLIMDAGSCIINIAANGNGRIITALASTTGDYYKKIEADITLSADAIPNITLNSWEEKSD